MKPPLGPVALADVRDACHQGAPALTVYIVGSVWGTPGKLIAAELDGPGVLAIVVHPSDATHDQRLRLGALEAVVNHLRLVIASGGQ